MKLVLKLEVEVGETDHAFIPADVASYVVDVVENWGNESVYGFGIEKATVRRIDIVRDEE